MNNEDGTEWEDGREVPIVTPDPISECFLKPQTHFPNRVALTLRWNLQILDVGCGVKKYPGSLGVDVNPASAADVICNLDSFPYPFADRTFEGLRAIHVIEHLTDVIRAMEEFHRLVRPGGRVRIETPHYTDFSSFCDPTHKHHLNSFSFRYFGEKHGGFGYYTAARFREISVHVQLLAFWKWLGFEFLVNRFPRFRKFWEFYLCYLIRGKAMEFVFEPIGPPVSDRRPASISPAS